MSKKKILLIDDETDFTDLVKMGLERAGDYDVRAESDPLASFDAAREFMPDLILLDIIMPKMDGTEVALRMSEDPALKDIPIVFLTGTVAGAEASSEGGLMGGRPCIAKPIDLKGLISSIERHLARG